jgi:hypothetical protein
MKTAAALIAGTLTAVALVGPGLAQTGSAPATPAAKPAPTDTTKPAATEAPKPAVAEPAKPAAPAAKAPAADPGAPASTKTVKPTAAPAAKPKGVSGEVVSVNVEKKTLIVKVAVAGKPTELTFGADKATGTALVDLKPGDHVRVAYTDAAGQRAATAVTRVPQAVKGPEAKGPEAKPKQ